MYIFGVVCSLTTIVLLFFIKEDKLNSNTDLDTEKEKESVPLLTTYKTIWKLFWLLPIRQFIVIALTIRVNPNLS
jgi:hypothetical protein